MRFIGKSFFDVFAFGVCGARTGRGNHVFQRQDVSLTKVLGPDR
ncbi:hypothetical protein RRSWK_05066 [Rhodopirellula sp. SWK7]|nr:hypothetical protein RRSWK_05066 [Rhodopirellula sp. SWK7]